MIFADRELAKRLEAAEGFACSQFAEARKRLFPESTSAWMTLAGATVVFDGVDAPTTQTFGLGLFEELTPDALDEIERFFLDRGTAVMHEVCPFAGAATLDLLCERGYQPIEISNVLYRAVDPGSDALPSNIGVRMIDQREAKLWSDISARGWTHEHPEFEAFVRDMGTVCVAREQSPCFLAEVDGTAGGAGALILHEGVALFGGAATVPELRRRGLQGALLQARMHHAEEHGCDLAMMVAEAGSKSQRNAERKGFRVAYTRMKWKLMHE
ncbi:MAG TPA: GNAT family N-acetyltransferase [Terracidiphilus sp.]|jgi:GNAT superfamily N-acetyltransferase